MRLVLLAAVLAVAGVVGLLVFSNPNDPRQNGNHRNGVPEDPKKDPDPVVAPDPLPDPRTQADAFLAECSKRGDTVLDELLKFLVTGEDEPFEPRWTFKNGELIGIPTLRALYLKALAAIDPQALRKVLPKTESIEETYFIALQLKDQAGWTEVALQRATADAKPLQQLIQREIVQLAARNDPAATAEFVLRAAPRGEDERAPRILATALTWLPEGGANATAEALLADADVTGQAKSLYISALCQRVEVSAIGTLALMAQKRMLDETTLIDAANQAAGAAGFLTDVVEYKMALSKGDAGGARSVRERFERRMEEVRQLVLAGFGVDLNAPPPDDPRAAALRKQLDSHRALLPK